MPLPTGLAVRPQRVHGGPDAWGVPLYDFSSNSNACGPCPGALQAVQLADATRYPDASYTALRHQLAGFHAVDVQRIVLAASASEFIFRITSWVAQQGGKTVRVPQHSYGDYTAAASAHRLALNVALSLAESPADLCWACEPSSPLGQTGDSLAGSPAHASAVRVLDRAYEPLRLSGAPSLTAAQSGRVWQLWTPNKALGLTGVRAAYAIAPLGAEAQVGALEALGPSWTVGAHGVAMLQAWVEAETQAWLADSLNVLRGWKVRQVAVLEALGWQCLPADANFFCAQPAMAPGQALLPLLQALRGQGIKLRDTSSFGLPGLVRLSVQPPDAQQALHEAWAHITSNTA